MKIVAISDLHGFLEPARKIIALERPDLLLCAGDWGTAEEVAGNDFEAITRTAHTFTVFGNNDHLELLRQIKNSDDTNILLENGKPVHYLDLTIAGINGIWAKSHKQPWYITDEEVAEAAAKLKDQSVDILITHGCPIGMADLTPTGGRGGQRCFTEAFKVVGPRLHLCGHLHRKSEYRTRDGKLVFNIGYTREGDYLLI
ncbi:MAG TPA: metallophosphoesterase family protein, partial [bacterium]